MSQDYAIIEDYQQNTIENWCQFTLRNTAATDQYLCVDVKSRIHDVNGSTPGHIFMTAGKTTQMKIQFNAAPEPNMEFSAQISRPIEIQVKLYPSYAHMAARTYSEIYTRCTYFPNLTHRALNFTAMITENEQAYQMALRQRTQPPRT